PRRLTDGSMRSSTGWRRRPSKGKDTMALARKVAAWLRVGPPGGATVLQDVRYALRTLGKSRSFAAVAVVTLALGISASTALFSVIDNVLMEPFPYADAQRLMTVQVHDMERTDPGGRPVFAGPELLDYAEQNHVFD